MVTISGPAERLERLLAALERELIEATGEEIPAAAADLGMSPSMKGSAAFFGITVGPSRLRRARAYGGGDGRPSTSPSRRRTVT